MHDFDLNEDHEDWFRFHVRLFIVFDLFEFKVLELKPLIWLRFLKISKMNAKTNHMFGIGL